MFFDYECKDMRKKQRWIGLTINTHLQCQLPANDKALQTTS